MKTIQKIGCCAVLAGMSFGAGLTCNNFKSSTSPERVFGLLLYAHHINTPLDKISQNSFRLSDLVDDSSSEDLVGYVSQMRVLVEDSKSQVALLQTEVRKTVASEQFKLPQGKGYSGSPENRRMALKSRISDHVLGCAMRLDHTFTDSQDLQAACNQAAQELADISAILDSM